MALGDKLPVVMGKEKAVAGGVATLGPDGILREGQRPPADAVPTDGSSNLVQSGGVYSALSNKVSHTADYVPAMQDLHGDARGLVCTVPAAAGPEIASINAPPGVEWGTCLSLQVGDIRTLMLIDTSGLWIQYGRPSGWTDWIHIATATPPQEYDLPLAEGLIQSSASWYSMDQFNQVHVHGAISAGSSGSLGWDTLVATLPEGYRPSVKIEAAATFDSDGTSGCGAVAVSEDGTIKAFPDISAPKKVVYFDVVFLATSK